MDEYQLVKDNLSNIASIFNSLYEVLVDFNPTSIPTTIKLLYLLTSIPPASPLPLNFSVSAYPIEKEGSCRINYMHIYDPDSEAKPDS